MQSNLTYVDKVGSKCLFRISRDQIGGCVNNPEITRVQLNCALRHRLDGDHQREKDNCHVSRPGRVCPEFTMYDLQITLCRIVINYNESFFKGTYFVHEVQVIRTLENWTLISSKKVSGNLTFKTPFVYWIGYLVALVVISYLPLPWEKPNIRDFKYRFNTKIFFVLFNSIALGSTLCMPFYCKLFSGPT